jgi:hypothetical protein
MKRTGTDLLLLAANAASLSAGALWLWTVAAGTQAPAPARDPDPVDTVAVGEPIREREVRSDSLAGRPPFNPARRPPAPQAVAEPEVEPPVLVGVVMSASPAALLAGAAGERSGLIRVGQGFGGWTVVSVRPTQVRLRAGERVIDVPLRPPQRDRPAGRRP